VQQNMLRPGKDQILISPGFTYASTTGS